MALTADERKAELVDRLASDARQRVGGEMGASAEQFVRRYFSLVAPDDIIYTAPETLMGGALSLWEFGAQRKPGQPRVRLFNPTTQKEGWGLEHTVLEVINDDMPFLVDSVTSELNRRERTMHLLIHPLAKTHRDTDGKRIEWSRGQSEGAKEITESYMHIEFDQETAPAELDAIRSSIERILSEVRVAVADWRPMRQKLGDVIRELDAEKLPMPPEEVEEARAFLRWLDEGHYIFLGYRRYKFKTEGSRDFLQLDESSGLGILREVRPESLQRSANPFSAEFSQYARRKDLLIIAKANNRSTVHRPVQMDRVGIKRYGPDGNLIGEDRFLGLFTSAAYSRSVREIPMVRLKVKRTMEHAGLSPNGHGGKALLEILETLPRDELFQITDQDLFHTSLGILQLQERQRVALFVRKDVFERFVSCLVFVPRDRYTAEFREGAKVLLENAFEGIVTAVHTHVSDSPLARGNFIVKTAPGRIPTYDIKRLEAYIAEASRTWADRLLDSLVVAKGEEVGIELHRRFKGAFPGAYAERFPATAAIYDIAHVEEVARTGELRVDLYRHRGEDQRQFHCKIIHSGPPVPLSDLMPRLENMGVKVQSEVPYEVTPLGAKETVRIRDFTLAAEGLPDDLSELKPKAEEGFIRVWKREAEDDGFNRLIVAAGLTWREIVILRAYAKYLRQTGVALSEAYIQQTLAGNPTITRSLVSLFEAHFDPKFKSGSRDERMASLSKDIEEALEDVSNPEEDRILRLYVNLITATLRTNFYQSDAKGNSKPYLSFKFDSTRVKELPLPRPMFEIFVYSPQMEGIHLRGGKVARGGIRWSDRREDFRTEILGLMKAQTVKNVVIVPVGSKGGFVVKQPPASGNRDEVLQEGIECYKTLLRGMLDITDNFSADEAVTPPRDVVRRDSDDPYLVVAADKGTATFSDIANGISADYGFWLGDAFASGGSAGYDHKKMGITARGGWEAVKRHFRELGMNTQKEDFTVLGIGDMSGDVFGNALLLSTHIKLVAAFNHVHIFLDPDPDPATSFDERRRLFNLPRSNWTDYNKDLLSAGGAIFERRSKTLEVSEQVRNRFELVSRTVTPTELIQALLRAKEDLLWLGGIGTYVKSSDEDDADARDRTNDAVRVNANQLRVRVVGEGANLGFTQKGRIEFALHGGKINTDAIDNSAGVDTSDHEVNIKILLAAEAARGALEPEKRLTLLAEMTDEVARLVLRDNYQQTQAISVAVAKGERAFDDQARFMRGLERAGKLDRSLESLPDDETVTARRAAHLGLTRPELAILLAYSKIAVYQDLLSSDFPDDPQLVEDLVLYFPKQIRTTFREAIERHRLRREIIATFITNTMVNRVGVTFVARLSEDTGRPAGDVARTYAIVRDSFDLRTVYKGIERLDNEVPPEVQTSMLIEVGRLVERTAYWLLRSEYQRLDVAGVVAEFGPRISALAGQLDSILPPGALASLQAREAEHMKLGSPPDLARKMASLPVLSSAMEIVRIARKNDDPVEDVGRVYFGVGERFDLDRMRAAASLVTADSPWQKIAIAAVIDDLFSVQGKLTSRVVQETSAPAGSGSLPAWGQTSSPVEAWLSSRPVAVSKVDQMLAEVRSASTVDLAMLTVVSRQLRALTES